jgi:hypothetical protein
MVASQYGTWCYTITERMTSDEVRLYKCECCPVYERYDGRYDKINGA